MISTLPAPRWSAADCAAQGHSPEDHEDPRDVALDSDAQAFADYLDADTQAAREDIARLLARRGYLTGAMVGAS